MMAKDELVVLLIAILLLFLYYKSAGYGKKEILFWIILSIPILFFSINMLTEIVTTDEVSYFMPFTDIRHVTEYSMPLRVLYEYRFTQLTSGTIFAVLSDGLKAELGERRLWQIYKIVHYFLLYIMSFFTAGVWRKWILDKEDEKRNRIAENAVLFSLVGLPLACMLLKVVNYDASSIYTAILGFSLVWASFKNNRYYLAFIGTMVTGLGCLDKWTSLPYWCACVALFAYLVIKNNASVVKKFVLGTGSFILSYTAAMDAGIKASKYGYIVTMDGDCQNDPADIPHMLEYLE